MKTKLKLFSALMALVILSVGLCSCGSANLKYSNGMAEESSSYVDRGSVDVSMKDTADGASSGSGNNSSNAIEDRKIIEHIDMTVQTREFDSFIDFISDEVSKCGGYIEESSVLGNGLNDKKSRRSATLTVRIPSSGSDSFVALISEAGNVTRNVLTTEDVTLSYVDTESRISALKTEKEALEKLLASAATTSDIISVRTRLTEVIYELESYTAKLRTYDNLVEYTTVLMDIDEVEKETVLEEESVWQRIGRGITESFENVGDFFVEFFVLFLVAIPYLLVIGAVAAIVILIVKFASKRRRKKAPAKKPEFYPVSTDNTSPYARPSESKGDDSENR